MTSVERKTLLMEQARVELGNCRRCSLNATRRTIIWGGGNVDAPIMLVAGNVTFAEDQSGLVLAGDAGNLVAYAMSQVGLRVDRDVFVAPVTRCQRPRVIDEVRGGMTRAEVTPEQVAACSPFLRWQISIVRPVIVVAHGRLAGQVLLGEQRPHVAYCGTWRIVGRNCIGLATHNPAGLVFGERRHLQGEYLEHWHGLAERLNLLGRMWRPDAECFQRGWSYQPKRSEAA